jgi:hypothetical protein
MLCELQPERSELDRDVRLLDLSDASPCNEAVLPADDLVSRRETATLEQRCRVVNLDVSDLAGSAALDDADGCR